MEDFTGFIAGLGLTYVHTREDVVDEFYFPDFCFRIVLVPLSISSSGSSGFADLLGQDSFQNKVFDAGDNPSKTSYLYEDRWWSANVAS